MASASTDLHRQFFIEDAALAAVKPLWNGTLATYGRGGKLIDKKSLVDFLPDGGHAKCLKELTRRPG
jgi:hypothetical protein